MTDPWFFPGSFGSWTHDPPISIGPAAVADASAIYISHVHEDHCQAESLAGFRRTIPIYCLGEPLELVPRKLRGMGFKNIIAMEPGGIREFGPFTLQMFGPFVKHPYFADDCEIGNVVDSALRIFDGRSMVLNANDNSLTVDVAQKFAHIDSRYDLAQLNWNNAGPYPACFDNLSWDEKLSEAKKCVDRNLSHLAAVSRALCARRVMPFAGAFKLAYGYEWMNPVLGTCSAEQAVEYLRSQDIDALTLSEGDSIEV